MIGFLLTVLVMSLIVRFCVRLSGDPLRRALWAARWVVYFAPVARTLAADARATRQAFSTWRATRRFRKGF